MKQILRCVLCALLTAVMLFTLTVSFYAASVDLTDDGKSVVPVGDFMFEKINNDTQWELDEYIGEGGEVITPRIYGDMLIVQFGNHCFMNNTTVTSVITSSPLWTIGEYAFIDCTALESIELNYALRTIGTGAFSGTSALKNINLEDSIVTQINPYTFLNSGIEEITLPETCTKIGMYGFGQCTELRKVTIPDSVTTIHPDAFKGSDNVVIYGSKDSYAIEYAKENGIDYVASVSFCLGDADNDGYLTIVDVTVIQRLLAGMITDDDGMIAMRGSVDGDALNIVHATKIQRYFAGLSADAAIGSTVTRVVERSPGIE